jgi:hypothetical protein
MAANKLKRIVWSAMFNSAMLSILFAQIAVQGFIAGNYFSVLFGSVAMFFSASDAIDAYRFRKDAKITSNGENNG